MTPASIIDNEKTARLVASPTLLDELRGLIQFHKSYDAIIVDCSLEGFLFPAEALLKAMNLASELLNLNGSLVFAKPDQILVLTKETSVGDIRVHTFSSLMQLYSFSASLARHLQQDDGSTLIEAGTDISDQILMSTIPVLTETGINSKAKAPSESKRRIVLKAIDNYSSISDISARLSTTADMSVEELKDELRSLEKDQFIYPIFPKVRFLAQCLRNGVQISVPEYLIASGLISKEALDELMMQRPSGNPDNRLGLGPLCVSKGYFPSRLLEITMYDLALYGGGNHKKTAEELGGSPSDPSLVQSLVGQLSNTDPAVLLQNMSSDRRSGILTVEYLERQFQCLYENGRVTHARLGEISGDDALIEFVATWREGIFVFIKRQPRPALIADPCKLTRPLDKLLLNAALAHDNQEIVWKKLPKGIETAVERLPDNDHLLERHDLVDVRDGDLLSPREIEVMQKIWEVSDGLSPISAIVRNTGNITASEAARAFDCLLHMNLLMIRETNLNAALQKFRQIAQAVGEHIGSERNLLILRVSLQSTYGYSNASRLFSLGSLGEIGIDLGAARSAGFAASELLKRLEDWQVHYVEALCQEIDVEVLRNIVYRIHGDTRSGSFLG